jgi:hypothetical protein
MNKVEFEVYRTTEKEERNTIAAEEIDNIPALGVRILLHGYTAPREDFFVGVRRSPKTGVREIGRAVGDGLVWEWQTVWPAYLLDPKKRVYGERTDLAFMMLLRDRCEHVASVVEPNEDWPGWERKRLPKIHIPARPWDPQYCEYAEGTKIR